MHVQTPHAHRAQSSKRAFVLTAYSADPLLDLRSARSSALSGTADRPQGHQGAAPRARVEAGRSTTVDALRQRACRMNTFLLLVLLCFLDVSPPPRSTTRLKMFCKAATANGRYATWEVASHALALTRTRAKSRGRRCADNRRLPASVAINLQMTHAPRT
jgi:uncharacterized protein RhaS with RHS repeats